MTFTRKAYKGRTAMPKSGSRTPVPSKTMRTFGKKKLTGKANALSRVKNATARAAISKSAGKTFPAGNLAAQAAKNIRSMIKKGGGATARVSAGSKKAVAMQRKPKR